MVKNNLHKSILCLRRSTEEYRLLIIVVGFFGVFYLLRYPVSKMFETGGSMLLAAIIISAITSAALGYFGGKLLASAAETRIKALIPSFSPKYKKELLYAFDEAQIMGLSGEEFNEFMKGAYAHKVKEKEDYINKMINKQEDYMNRMINKKGE